MTLLFFLCFAFCSLHAYRSITVLERDDELIYIEENEPDDDRAREDD